MQLLGKFYLSYNTEFMKKGKHVNLAQILGST